MLQFQIDLEVSSPGWRVGSPILDFVCLFAISKGDSRTKIRGQGKKVENKTNIIYGCTFFCLKMNASDQSTKKHGK